MTTRRANPCLVSDNSLHANLQKAVCLYWYSPGFMSLSVLTLCSKMCTSNRCASPAGEYRLSREDGAHYQGVPHPSQPLGSVLQPVSRTHGNLHTGTPDEHCMWRVLGICPSKEMHSFELRGKFHLGNFGVLKGNHNSKPLVFPDKRQCTLWDKASKARPHRLGCLIYIWERRHMLVLKMSLNKADHHHC